MKNLTLLCLLLLTACKKEETIVPFREGPLVKTMTQFLGSEEGAMLVTTYTYDQAGRITKLCKERMDHRLIQKATETTIYTVTYDAGSAQIEYVNQLFNIKMRKELHISVMLNEAGLMTGGNYTGRSINGTNPSGPPRINEFTGDYKIAYQDGLLYAFLESGMSKHTWDTPGNDLSSSRAQSFTGSGATRTILTETKSQYESGNILSWERNSCSIQYSPHKNTTNIDFSEGSYNSFLELGLAGSLPPYIPAKIQCSVYDQKAEKKLDYQVSFSCEFDQAGRISRVIREPGFQANPYYPAITDFTYYE